MSAPFPDLDFLTGNWRPLNELARKTDEPFPVDLPELYALDFDKIKDSVCAYRGWELCSVDAVTIAEDGRIFFVEFKDTGDNPVAWLKKKGFDSLLLFWIAVGRSLSMEEIRDRVVFCYVYNPKPRYDDAIGQDFQQAAEEQPIASKPDQLDELRNSGLYGEVRHLNPNEFCDMIRGVTVAQSIEELQRLLAVSYQPIRPRLPVPGLDCASGDFKSCVSPIAELRMPYPFDQKIHKVKCLRAAETYDADAELVSWKHDWNQNYPIMGLMSCCFDSFALWSLAYRSDSPLTEVGETLNARIEFSGDAPPAIPEPPNTRADAYRHRFWEVYSPHFNSRFGLPVFEQVRVYNRINCDSVDSAKVEDN